MMSLDSTILEKCKNKSDRMRDREKSERRASNRLPGMYSHVSHNNWEKFWEMCCYAIFLLLNTMSLLLTPLTWFLESVGNVSIQSTVIPFCYRNEVSYCFSFCIIMSVLWMLLSAVRLPLVQVIVLYRWTFLLLLGDFIMTTSWIVNSKVVFLMIMCVV